jgi:hypothetical protein
MRIAKAGERAKPGLWLDIRTCRFHLQEPGDGPLPGPAETRWLRVPILVWIVLGPVFGFVYVVLLPVVGAVLAVRELALKGRDVVRRASRRHGEAPSPR